MGSPRILLTVGQDEASCPRSQLPAAMGTQSSHSTNPVPPATGQPKGYTHSPLTPTEGHGGIFGLLLSWNKVILPKEPVDGLLDVHLGGEGQE